jgi:Domain of unknown function (DUF4124)
MPKQIFLVVLAVLSAQLALAQQIYKWADGKGQWHYSDFLPSGVRGEKLGIEDTIQSDAQPSVSSADQRKKVEDSSGRSTQAASDVDRLGSIGRRLLVFPPSDTSQPLSDWIPTESFSSVEECTRARDLLIAGSLVRSETTTSVDFGALNSRCISLAEFKPSKEANVLVAVTKIGQDPGIFSTSVVYGRVFNRGQTTARNVVVRYQVRDARGIIYANGEIPTAPQDISPLMFAEFRGQILGSLNGSDRWVQTEASWSRE